MPPNPMPYVGTLLADAAKLVGYETYPQPAAVNSRRYKGRPACGACGLCSGFGCPINARGDALVSWLNPAVRARNVRVISRAFAYRIETSRNGRKARGVRYLDARGRRHKLAADVVVVAGSPINTARLLLMSASNAHPEGLGNRSGQLGRNMMFHNFTLATAIFQEDLHPNRAQSNPLQMDDLIGPFTGPEVKALGVPYVKGGLVQVGGALTLMTEAGLYAGTIGWGLAHKQAMKQGVLHSKISGSQLVHEDLPQADNRIDLDPEVRDHNGFPAARITYSPHQHEKAAATLLGARLEAMHALAPGATGAAIVPWPLINAGAQNTAHLAGTARMGEDPRTSVCAPDGRLHEVDNVYVADASTFPTFPGFNPTNTIMANALRVSRGVET
jgi:choline dehydrogenase-like flavoprotein